MPLLEAFTFVSFWALGLGLSTLEQSRLSIAAEVGESINIGCKITSTSFEKDAIHWYRQKPNQALEHLIYVISTKGPVRSYADEKRNKVEARKNSQLLSSTLRIYFIGKEDTGTYYCAGWNTQSLWGRRRYRKVFGDGTKLIVTERSYGSEFYPKPTIFRPSAAEINLHKAGTHLCLLEKFFPDVIKVYWKEEDGDTILESQQGNTTKVGDSYMKFSWLTVSEESMHKEHRCIVKHEHNKVDQEIIFPAIKKVTRDDYHEGEKVPLPEVAVINHKIEVYLEDKSDIFQLQLINTSAYYTYLLLLLKSLVYLVVISVCLVRRTAVCDHGKSS